MDIEFIKEQIYHLDGNNKKIQPGEYLSAEIINMLRDGSITDRVACFAPTGNPKETCLFECEINCSKCNVSIIRATSKTALLDYLRGRNSILCDNCMNEHLKQQEEDKVKSIIKLKELEEKIVRITDGYIKSYLDPAQKWDKDLPSYARAELILDRSDVDYNKVTDYIKAMPYQDFLQTLYWETISSYKKYKENYQCAICGGNKNLATHHRTYKRHGKEHIHQVIKEDLIVLCKDCHSKFHDKI